MSKEIKEIKQSLARGSEQQRLAALSQTLNYGQQGLDLLIAQSLKDPSERVKQSAYWILHGYNPYLTGNSTEESRSPTDTITCLAMSPDNKIIVGGSWQKSLVWHLQTGEIFRSFPGHSHWVLAVSISPDGKTLVSGSADKTIKVWSLETGKLIHTLNGHSSWVNTVAITPDGKTIVSGSADKTIKIWDLDNQKLKTTIKRENELQSIVSLAISPDGKIIVSGDTANKITFWNLESGELIRTLEGHSDWIKVLFITSDSKALISGSRDGTLKIWQSYLGSEKESFKLNQSSSTIRKGFVDIIATGVGFSLGGPIGVAVGIGVLTLGRFVFDSNSSTQLSVKTLECLNTYPYNQAINSLYCSQDKVVIAYKNTIQISALNCGPSRITIDNQKNIQVPLLKNIENINLPGEYSFINSVAISYDGNFFASASNDWIMLWDMQTGKPLHSLQGCSYPRLSNIKIIPEAPQEVLCGKSVQFTVKSIDQNKREIKLKDEDVKWEVTGGNIEQCIFTAGQSEGKFEAKVRVGIFEASIPITIIEPPKITQLVVAPSNATLEFGKIIKITAQVLDQRGNLMIQETVSWQASPKSGTVNQTGNFKAGYNPGKFEIIALAGSIQKIIPVSVIEPPKLKEIIITSSTPKLEFGQSFQFKVKGVDQYGEEIKLGEVTWSATSDTIDTNNGIFYASNREETVIIEASVGEISTHIKIEVYEPSRLTTIQIFPSSVTLQPGQTQNFSVVSFNQRDEEIFVGDIHWDTTDGIINQSGCFHTKTNQKGYCKVTVTIGHLSVTAEVVVPSIVISIKVSPEKVELKPEEEFLFTVTGFDQTGDHQKIKNVQWSTTPDNLITTQGVFKGNFKHREVTVTAILRELSATAKVNLLPVLKRLNIYPGFVYLKPGEKQTFAVKGFDQFGGAIDTGEINWETTGGKIAQNGLLTVTDDDQGYIQVTATSKLTPKHSQNLRTLFLYTGISSRIISLLISYETLKNAVLALDSDSAEAEQLGDLASTEEDLGDSVKAEEKLDIDLDTNQDTDTIVQAEEGLDIESVGGTEAAQLLDTNVLDFKTALQGYLFQKLIKLAARCFRSISRFCFDEASAHLNASADVFVLTVEHNPYKYFECLNLLDEHLDFVTSLAITPDGQRLISGSHDRTIKFWDLNTGNLLHTLVHEINVVCLAITPDGQQLVSSGWDGTIKFWDLNNSALLHSLKFLHIVYFVAITSDGRNIIGCETSNEITIFNLSDRGILKHFRTHSSNYYYYYCHYLSLKNCTIVTPDNRKIITSRKFIKVYELETGKLLKILGVNLGWIYALAITPDGKKLISSHEQTITIRDLTTKNYDIMLNLEAYDQEVYVLIVTPDGQRIVSAGRRIKRNFKSQEINNYESCIEIWDLNTGEKLHSIESYTKKNDYVCCLAITPDGKQIISGYTNGTIKIWGVPELNTLSESETHSFI